MCVVCVSTCGVDRWLHMHMRAEFLVVSSAISVYLIF